MNEQNKVRVGIFCPEPFLGGEIIYINSVVDACSKIDNIVEIIIFTNQEATRHFKKNNAAIVTFMPKYPRSGRDKVNLPKRGFFYILEKSRLANFVRRRLPVDVLIAPYVCYDLLRLENPYIVNPQDLRHKCYKEAKATLRAKLSDMVFESLYSRVIEQACFLVVDSNYNKQDLMKYYSIPENKIKIIHSLPDLVALESLKEFEEQGHLGKYNLCDEYIYYPAHLIETKNHLNLLEALRIIKENHGETIPLILSGGEQALLPQIQERAKRYDISVRYLGYISYSDVILTLKKAKALVFASLFDPYALPIWEAFYVGVPVVSSNVCALPEQVGDAGLLFDPNNIDDMAEKIYTVWTDESLRKELIRKGYERTKDLTLENYAKQWEEVIEAAIRDYKRTNISGKGGIFCRA
jgi:glycosyltransferase involved in cell wall biosynthesis